MLKKTTKKIILYYNVYIYYTATILYHSLENKFIICIMTMIPKRLIIVIILRSSCSNFYIIINLAARPAAESSAGTPRRRVSLRKLLSSLRLQFDAQRTAYIMRSFARITLKKKCRCVPITISYIIIHIYTIICRIPFNEVIASIYSTMYAVCV